MARIHNGIQYYTQLIEGFRRALGEHGEWGIERAGETLTPILDFWSQPEWAFLRGESLDGATLSQAAVAAELPFISLGNPQGSGLLMVVEAINVSLLAADSVSIGCRADSLVLAVQDASTTGVVRDRRAGGANFVSRGVVRRGGNAATIGHQIQEVLRLGGAGTLPAITPPYVLQPDQAVVVERNVVNTELRVSFRYRMRPLLPGEL